VVLPPVLKGAIPTEQALPAEMKSHFLLEGSQMPDLNALCFIKVTQILKPAHNCNIHMFLNLMWSFNSYGRPYQMLNLTKAVLTQYGIVKRELSRVS